MVATLDITGLTCPMTWVRTKLALERLEPGAELVVLCPEGEALENVPRSARDAGHEVAVGGRRRAHRAAVSGTSRRGLFRAAAAAAIDAARIAQAEAQSAAPAPLLPAEDLERYARQLVLPEWGEREQLRIKEASVLVVGAGALGAPVALYLAGAGVGRLGVVDDDVVDVSNLHRQPLYTNLDVGEAKAQVAAARLRHLNPDVQVEPYQARLQEDNAALLVEGQDLVVDCSDSFETRYLVNAACCAAGIPLVEAGVAGFTGLVMSIRPGETACYRCAFPAAPSHAPSCAEAGVLGPAAGVVGSLQALEALKLLAGIPRPVVDGFVEIDLADASVVRVETGRRLDCPDCGR